ncbi:hypothetical protein MA04_04154 [Alcanivorax balearicus MACL04]|uniref:Uncharacterized protein n=2 Tax=Alloalcanivorax TaxID=3020832 RepID=A0A9Q3ZG24_9GAMM|nr:MULTISPECIES: hypothetical protein [Alloalcanivorax]MCE7510406.1 hypothetical protein [Alloalcanivorax xenomutans]MCU5784854.1 hypothetical protein [Alloalcanivorax balearicus MACL04]
MNHRQQAIAKTITTLLALMEQTRPMQALHASIEQKINAETVVAYVGQMYLYDVDGEEHAVRLEELEADPISADEIGQVAQAYLSEVVLSKILSGQSIEPIR